MQSRGSGSPSRRTRRRALGALLVAAACLTVGQLSEQASGVLSAGTPPNIVFVLTDDQSPSMLARMPYLNSEPEGSWVRFTNAFVSLPLCCPSRATILSGLYAHHHGVVHNSGGRFNDASTLATWLDGVGYTTGLFGKYLNSYPFSGRPPNYIPPGWDQWAAFRDQAYYNYELNENGTWVHYGSQAHEYSTDVLAAKTADFVTTAAEPFFAYYSVQAPHTSHTPAPRHKGRFASLPIDRSPNFNEADVSDKPAWVRALGSIDEAGMMRRERGASETLLAVDEGIARIVEALRARGILENTVIVFMTDNGYAFGNHRWNHKRCAYEECIRTPLLVRYPGQAERDEERLVVNIDIAPTLAELAGAGIPYAPDGRSLVPLLTGAPVEDWRTSFLLQFVDPSPPPPWWGVRTERWKYVELSTGERELYDLAGDPFELDNRAGDPAFADTQAALAAELERLRADGSPAPPPPPPPPPANRPPVAVNDAYATAPGVPLTAAAPGVLANDSDPDQSALTAAKETDPANGTLTLNPDGSFEYTPSVVFTGTDTFTYRASDGALTSNAANVSVSVEEPGASPPVARGDGDAYVRSRYPTENNGAAKTLRAYTSGGRETRSYLKFVVTGLDGPAGSATLRLFVTDTSSAGGVLHVVPDTAWHERELTWATRPALGAELSPVGPVLQRNRWVELDVTAAVNGSKTYAFAIAGSSSDVAYYSSEEGANPPQLVVSPAPVLSAAALLLTD